MTKTTKPNQNNTNTNPILAIQNLKLKDIVHLYVGCEVRIMNKVTNQWSNWRKITFTDYNLIVNHDEQAQIKLRNLDDISEIEAYELAKIYDPTVTQKYFEEITAIEYLKGGRYVNSIWSISTAPSNAFRYLLTRNFDLFELIGTEYAIKY
jgi:hypothetical protein